MCCAICLTCSTLCSGGDTCVYAAGTSATTTSTTGASVSHGVGISHEEGNSDTVTASSQITVPAGQCYEEYFHVVADSSGSINCAATFEVQTHTGADVCGAWRADVSCTGREIAFLGDYCDRTGHRSGAAATCASVVLVALGAAVALFA